LDRNALVLFGNTSVCEAAFKNEVFEEQVPNPEARQQSGIGTTADDIQRVYWFCRFI